MSQSAPASLQLKVITSTRLLVEEEVKEVTLPSVEGCLGILPGHCPLLVAIGEGELSYKSAGKTGEFSIAGGYAEILPERVLVFTEIHQNDKNKIDKR